jgi:hypothetical protein
LFVVRIRAFDPRNCFFLLKLKNKMQIGDANMNVLRNRANNFKELVVSYKTIFVNTYSVVVFDICRQKSHK